MSRFYSIVLCMSVVIFPVAACESTPRDDHHSAGAPLAPRVVVMTQAKTFIGMGVTAKNGDQRLPVYEVLPDSDPRVAAAHAALGAPPVRRLLLLLEGAKRRATAAPADLPAQSWERARNAPFYLSVDGGLQEFGGVGFVLRQQDGDVVHELTPFVELVGTLEDLQSPYYAQSLVHEVSHALLGFALASWMVPCARNREACGRTPSAFHDVQRPTQPLQAFNEGFAEHMEALAFLEAPGLARYDYWLQPEGAISAARGYASPRPRRLEMIVWNRAIFEPALIPEDVIARDGIAAAHRQYQNSQPIDDHRLKTCREILSTEGAVASILVRLAVDHGLQEAPLPDEVVAGFAPADAAARAAWLQELGPTGPVHLRLLAVLMSLPGGPVDELGERGVREVIESWLARFPDDEKRVKAILIATTLGTTASAPFADRLRTLLRSPAIVPPRDPNHRALRDAVTELADLAESTANAQLFAACGPPLWVHVDGHELCADFGPLCLPLEIDLNAASEMDLRLLPGVTAELARQLLAHRAARGYFSDRTELLSIAKSSPADASRFPPKPAPGLP